MSCSQALVHCSTTLWSAHSYSSHLPFLTVKLDGLLNKNRSFSAPPSQHRSRLHASIAACFSFMYRSVRAVLLIAVRLRLLLFGPLTSSCPPAVYSDVPLVLSWLAVRRLAAALADSEPLNVHRGAFTVMRVACITARVSEADSELEIWGRSVALRTRVGCRPYLVARSPSRTARSSCCQIDRILVAASRQGRGP
jgi:hypothetical protein